MFHPSSSQASFANPGRSENATRASVTFERRGFPYLKTIKFRCSSLVGRAGSKLPAELHSGNDREGRIRLKIYERHGKCIAVTTQRSKERQKMHTHTHTLTQTPNFLQIRKQSLKVKIQERCNNYHRGSFRGPIICRKVIGRMFCQALFFTVLSPSFAIKKTLDFLNVQHSRVIFSNSNRNLSKSN